jgi:hypothetical protein
MYVILIEEVEYESSVEMSDYARWCSGLKRGS